MTARNYSYRTKPPPFPNWKRRGFYLQNMKKAGAKRTLLRRGAGGGTRTRTPSLVMDFESTSSTNSNTPAFFQFGLYYTRSRSKMQEKFVGISSIRTPPIFRQNLPPAQIPADSQMALPPHAAGHTPPRPHSPDSGKTPASPRRSGRKYTASPRPLHVPSSRPP